MVGREAGQRPQRQRRRLLGGRAGSRKNRSSSSSNATPTMPRQRRTLELDLLATVHRTAGVPCETGPRRAALAALHLFRQTQPGDGEVAVSRRLAAPSLEAPGRDRPRTPRPCGRRLMPLDAGSRSLLTRRAARCIAITGATGFVGRSIVRDLRDRGWRLRALGAPARSARWPTAIEQVPGSWTTAASLSRARSRCSDRRPLCRRGTRRREGRDFRRVNARSGRTLAGGRAAGAATGRGSLLISSLAAREPRLSAYAASKREAEDMLGASAASNHCIIRPPAVYGPGDRTTLPLFRLLTRRLAVLPGSSRSRFSLHLRRRPGGAASPPSSTARAGTESLLEPDDGQPGGYAWADLAAIAGRQPGYSRPSAAGAEDGCFGFLPSISQAMASPLGRLPAHYARQAARALSPRLGLPRATARGLLARMAGDGRRFVRGLRASPCAGMSGTAGSGAPSIVHSSRSGMVTW